MASVLWLPSKRIRRPAGIGTRVAHIRFRFNEYGAYATRAPNEVRPPLNPVPQRAKSVRRRLRDAGFQVEAAGEVVVWSEGRSEEHTSELQSLMRISYAVFCLKKKN